MGAFGHKIFQDDFAIEIREQYLDMLHDGVSNEKATLQLIEENTDADIDEAPVFWLSLAAVQFEYGRLTEQVKLKAISVIDSGADMEKWNGDKKRAKELEKLKLNLLGEQGKEKRLVKQIKKTWQSGDVFVFKFDEENYGYGRYIVYDFVAIYQFKTPDNKLPVNEIIQNKVAFVVYASPEFTNSRKVKIIGNSPLEKVFSDPIYFYHMSVGELTCRVFSIWDKYHTETDYHYTDCSKIDWGPFGIEQCGIYQTMHIIWRLDHLLGGPSRFHSDYYVNGEPLPFRICLATLQYTLKRSGQARSAD